MPRVKFDTLILNLVEQRSLRSFYSEVDHLSRCLRCAHRIQSGDLVAAMGQVLPLGKQHKIVGGLLCEPCVEDFHSWTSMELEAKR